MPPSKKSLEIKAEIEARFGFFPPFFEPALQTPTVIDLLWQQTKSSYLDNPLPALFKEKLATLISRFCPVNYCFICHASNLREQGMNGSQVLELLSEPVFPVQFADLSRASVFPESGSPCERAVLGCAVAIFLNRNAEHAYAQLKKALPLTDYQFLSVFVAYLQTCLNWAQANPELQTFEDLRAKTHYEPMLKEAPGLRSVFEAKAGNFFVEEERAKLHELFRQAPFAISIIEGPELIFTFANPAFTRFADRERITGLTLAEVFPKSELSEIRKIFDGVIASGAIYQAKEMPVTQIDASGVTKTLYFDFICQPFYNSAGEKAGLLSIANDVTEMALAQLQFKSRAGQLQIIADRLPAFVAYLNRDRQYEFVNATYERWFKKSKSEIIGKTRASFISPEAARTALQFEDQAFRGVPARHENTLTNDQDQKMEVDIEYLPDFDPLTAGVRGVVIIARDVTESKTLLRTAELAKQELQLVFTSAPVGICVFEGPKHRYLLANPSYQTIVFGEPREVIGKSIWDTLTNDGNKAYIGLLDQVFQTGRPFTAKESLLRIPRPNLPMKEIYINFSIEPKRNAEGVIDGVFAVVYEVTDQVLARRKVELAVQARDEFLSIASHELKTPLTSLQLQCQMMKRNMLKDEAKAVAPERVSKLVDQTDRSVQRLTRLVEDMFDIARISTGKLILNCEPFDLIELAKDVIDRLSPQILSAEIKVSLIAEEVLGSWDRFRLDQVLTNLLTNAIRYGAGSPVEIRVSKTADFARLEVQDHGPGIAPENLDRIFERFERAHSSNSITGLGLGLYISQEIVGRHGGIIRVESTIGKGASFIVELPFSAG